MEGGFTNNKVETYHRGTRVKCQNDDEDAEKSSCLTAAADSEGRSAIAIKDQHDADGG